ncbi:MAG: hypothetical protein HY784_04590, partial [Chloroflexi bacterium]|nr:hypothetical protein [Chloroflexota bacterium]
GVSLLLGAMLGAAAVLGPGQGKAARNGTRGGGQETGRPPQQAVLFALIMLFSGTLLAIGPEYFYLRDQFGTRMNTVFKFYYQTWVLWSGAAAFLLWWVSGEMGRGARAATVATATLAIGLGLVYPALALPTKTNNFQPDAGPTLDSTAEFAQYNLEDYAAILWIQANLKDEGVIAEAVGGSYTGYARISAFTGHPTVLGWPGHEGQWRGGYTEVGSREAEIEQLYRERDWTRVLPILDKYNIRYVYVGPMERGRYNPVATDKFDRFMRVVYQAGAVTIYER